MKIPTIAKLQQENESLRERVDQLQLYLDALRLRFGDPAVNGVICGLRPRSSRRRLTGAEAKERMETFQRVAASRSHLSGSKGRPAAVASS